MTAEEIAQRLADCTGDLEPGEPPPGWVPAPELFSRPVVTNGIMGDCLADDEPADPPA